MKRGLVIFLLVELVVFTVVCMSAPRKDTVPKVSYYYKTESTISDSMPVYKTPTGKRYHLDPDCGGKNSNETTLKYALNIGLTPCKKCAE